MSTIEKIDKKHHDLVDLYNLAASKLISDLVACKYQIFIITDRYIGIVHVLL